MSNADDDLFAPIRPAGSVRSVSDIINPEIRDADGVKAKDLYYRQDQEFQIYGQTVIYRVVVPGDYFTAQAKSI